MASVDPEIKTTYATTDWHQYQQGRPPYPPSLTKLIYDYRRRHANAGWERLVDVGAGSGVASTNFMANFRVVHNSDPSPMNEQQARAFLPEWARRHGCSDTVFEYSQSTGEDAYRHVGEGQADLAICATAAHFMDPDGLVGSIAKMLRPGGTLAIFSYWLPTFPGLSPRFHEAFGKTFDRVVLSLLASGDEVERRRFDSLVERRMSGKGVLDSVPVPEELYEDPLRVYINSSTSDAPYKYLFQKYVPAGSEPGGISRVGPGDEVASYHSGTDTAAEGWAFDADKKWFTGFFDTFRSSDNKLSELEARDIFADLELAFDQECSNGIVRIQWPAYLVLATRK